MNKFQPINEIGSHRTGSLYGTYKNLIKILGEPNVTDLDDPDKVSASWGLKDQESGKKMFIWCYRCKPNTCTDWSTYGDEQLLSELQEVLNTMR